MTHNWDSLVEHFGPADREEVERQKQELRDELMLGMQIFFCRWCGIDRPTWQHSGTYTMAAPVCTTCQPHVWEKRHYELHPIFVKSLPRMTMMERAGQLVLMRPGRPSIQYDDANMAFLSVWNALRRDTRLASDVASDLADAFVHSARKEKWSELGTD